MKTFEQTACRQRRVLFFLVFFQVLTTQLTLAQHAVFFFGNLADVEDKPAWFQQLDKVFKATGLPFTLILNGDLVSREITAENETEEAGHVLSLVDMAEQYPHGKLLIIPGDRDWNSSKKGGEKSLKRLEERVRNHIKEKGCKHSQWAVQDGCPGPEIFEVDESLVIIAVNTQWWNHPYDKPRPSDGSCEALLPENLKEELEDAVEKYQDRNVLMAGHHPIHSVGNHGGYFSVGQQLVPLPVIGGFRTAFHTSVGRPSDISNQRLHTYVESMKNLLFFHSNIIYASGHEHNQQILRWGDNYLLNSGAPDKANYTGKDQHTVFSKRAAGIMQIVYAPNGQVDALFRPFDEAGGFQKEPSSFNLFRSSCEENVAEGKLLNTSCAPCVSKKKGSDKMQGNYTSELEVVAGPEYKAGWFKQIWFGKHYRSTWTTPVKSRYLDLDSAEGGLTIYKKGGGRQTTSLKFKSGIGTEFTFRSVNKDPSKALNYLLRPTVAASVIRDQTSTQHPYGAMAIAPLLNQIGILHATPTLYVLPDDPKLGPFQEKYGNLFGMLEESPGGPDYAGKLFGGADAIEHSTEMFRHFYTDQKSKVDKQEFARARLFDILVGDWSKHEDNWKWAMFINDNKFKVYRPIPRDRDHVFSRQDGVFPWLADRPYGLANIENFGFDNPDVRSLTFQAQHMDRFLLAEAPKDLFMQEAKYIQDNISENDFEKAVRNMPQETYEKSGKIVEAKLKKRMLHLSKYAEEYYALLAKEVDVTGSKENEYFEAEHLSGGALKVRMYEAKGSEKGETLLYERTFLPKETKEVRLWGLGSEDVFDIGGSGPGAIKVRAFGGPGDDVFKVNTPAKTLLYDKGENTKFETGQGGKIVNHWDRELYEYDRLRFAYNHFFPLAYIAYNNFTGFGINLGGTVTVQKFGKRNYHSKHNFGAGITTNSNKSIHYTGRFHHVIHKWDVEVGGLFADPDFFNYFYGLGNNSVKDEDQFGRSFYEAKVNRAAFSLGIIRDFWRQCSFEIKAGIERNENERLTGKLLDLNVNTVPGAHQTLTILPVEASVDLDFRDKKGLPYRGTRAFLSYTNGTILDGGGDNFSVAEGFIEYYLSTRRRHPLTLAFRAGGAKGNGDIPWYKMPRLGNGNGLRGYFNNRWTGSSSAYFNGELRYQFAEKSTAFIPVKAGVKVFYDRGRVFNKGDEGNDSWRDGYGFGFYLVPLSESLTLSLSLSFSDEESVYPVFSIGAPLR